MALAVKITRKPVYEQNVQTRSSCHVQEAKKNPQSLHYSEAVVKFLQLLDKTLGFAKQAASSQPTRKENQSSAICI